ncbi:uncharacterized protein Z520_09390 [Fonsecaea multimorphosa CBS 102226]|uniref:BZIP domain-containing protein n=1 Tax=Fonsecaea multimorphosa CBS 102226 TaxID=1442371 RepID=A0A0D2GZU2_9EURO|nr:uncharacterized protein Z520_09390 [Fonsecaea multimorphosa CBS 102226]KIX95080.1 hypothetical protein Z520_09390 [Fonsecaea multimorphosa CBS 102226]OAL20723.1 hypothetical protein AYO22_08732 [Fonsecaea multimorphosa]
MDYFAAPAAPRGSYFESLVDADSSSSSSPDNMADVFRYGSIESDMFPPGHGWDPADLDTLDTFTHFKPDTTRHASAQSSTDSEQTVVPPSKVVRQFLTDEARATANEQGQRRRAQNRASQRAFRERKEKHLKGLEYQLETLNEKHQDLLCSYNKQSDSIIRLNRKIAQLQADLEAFRFTAAMADPPTSQPCQRRKWHGPNPKVMPDKFDAFSNAANFGPVLYDGYELGPDGTVVNTVDTQNARQATRTGRRLPEFEDLLRMQ